MVTYNTLGVGKHIISIYDGDVKDEINKKQEYKYLPKCIIEKDKKFIKLIGDKYFNQRSISDIIADYLNDPRTSISKDTDGKKFYKVILSNLEKIGISEKDFIKYLCDDIYNYADMKRVTSSLTLLLK